MVIEIVNFQRSNDWQKPQLFPPLLTVWDFQKKRSIMSHGPPTFPITKNMLKKKTQEKTQPDGSPKS